MTERRKLNDVYHKPLTRGYVTIMGVIGSGKTREEVILKQKSPIEEYEYIEWRHHIGEQWKVLEPLTKEVE